MQRALSMGLIVLASVAAPQRAVAQVTEFDFFKAAAYFQLADNTQPASAVAYVADGGVFTVLPGDYAGGNIDNEFVFEFDGGEWTFQVLYASLAGLNARFPAGGSLTANLLAGAEPAVSQTVMLGADLFPTAVPYLTGTSFSDLSGMDPTVPHMVTINTRASANADLGFFEILDESSGGAGLVFEESLGASQSTVTIPAGTLEPETSYTLEFYFTNLDAFSADPSGFDVPYVVGYDRVTIIEFVTGASPCQADLSNDGVVDGMDLAAILAAWGGDNTLVDLNGDGVIDGMDLAGVLAAWGPCS